MEHRLEFVLLALKHEHSMAELCRQFGISRQTGYELLAHYTTEGLDGLKPHSRAPRHHPNAIDEQVCAAVIRAKARHPSWGPKKLQPLADESETIKQRWPVASTRGTILARSWHAPAWWCRVAERVRTCRRERSRLAQSVRPTTRGVPISRAGFGQAMARGVIH